MTVNSPHGINFSQDTADGYSNNIAEKDGVTTVWSRFRLGNGTLQLMPDQPAFGWALDADGRVSVEN